jgi:8-oxo-dGTP diphosphatase
VSSIGEPEPVATIVVDVANVMGARADGWWRDRAGAALRLCGQVIELAARGIPADLMPGGLAAAPPASAPIPPARAPAPAEWVLVLEGRARDAAAGAAELIAAAGVARVRVVRAPGSGDDAIAGEAASAGGPCLVVTADRELRRRCTAAGAAVAGPGWLLGLL